MLGLINIIFSYSVIVISALTQIPLIKYSYELNAFVPFEYSLLYIVVFTLSLSFKHNYSFMAVLAYLVSGLAGLPVFAFGGGWQYIFEPSFGYLLALLPMTIIAFYNRFHGEDSGIKTLCGCNLSPVIALLVAHGLGQVFIIVTGRFSFQEFFDLHIYQLIYDLIFAYFVIVIIGFYDKSTREISSEQDPITDL